MRYVDVYNTNTGCWDPYMIGKEDEFGKPLTVKRTRPKRKKRIGIKTRTRNTTKTVRVPKHVDTVVLEFPYEVEPTVEYIYW